MPKLRTHYDNLKVSRDAPIEVIQAAYRSLARKYHPDRNSSNPAGEAMMKTINASYEILSDPAKRAEHDRWISNQLNPRGSFFPHADTQTHSDPDPRRAPRRTSSESHPERLTRSLVVMVFSLCYFTTAFWLLRSPASRLIGIGMLIAGWLYFSRRR